MYDDETETSRYVLPSDAEITSDTDDFGRTEHVYLKDSDGNNILTATYTYVDKTVDGEVLTSDRIASITYTANHSYTYTYDAVGNITSVSDGTHTTSYEYDTLYQLTRENNEKAGKTWTYTYDKSGNILTKCEYAYTVGTLGTALDTITYTYANEDWGDQLTAYDGTAITYDAQGNPLNWRDGMAFSWTGRQLDSISKNGETLASFTYDANGMRTGKTVGTENFTYLWQDGKLVAEFYGNSDTLPEGSTYNPMDTQYYIYDESGSPVAWSYADQYYYYIKNQQGDILGFTDSEGNLIATYEYDAWGKLLHTEASDQYGANLAEFNSLRYRGYQYDVETGLYYLQSRYYDPEVGRFLNADDTDYLGASGTVLGYNLYAYCENNVVDFLDETGFLYSPSKALAYARKWWNSYNPEYMHYERDCTNFISQCLHAGGHKMSTKWKVSFRTYLAKKGTYECIDMRASKSWTSVKAFYKYLKSKMSYFKIKSRGDLNSAIVNRKVWSGNVIIFMKDGVAYHAALVGVVSYPDRNVYYFAHTHPRNGDNCSRGIKEALESGIYSSIYIFKIK